MDFGAWDRLFNLVLLVVWFGIWHSGERRVLFNSYLAPLVRVNQKVSEKLRPYLFNMDERGILSIVFTALIVIRALVVASGARWQLAMGELLQVQAHTSSLIACLLFSILSFGVFLFQVWGVSLLYVHGKRSASFSTTSETLFELSRPFSDLRIDYRPPVLIAAGMLLSYLLATIGQPVGVRGYAMTGLSQSPVRAIVLCFLTGLSGWTTILLLLRILIFVLIIGSWISMFTHSQALMFFCRDWLDFVIGPLRRYPLRLGPIDLTPIVMIFALNLFYGFLMYILANSFDKLS